MSSTTQTAGMQKFLEAITSIYGPFPPSRSPTPSQWFPPPLLGQSHRGRYLWTDAFGVLNFLTLFTLTDDPEYLKFARSLISTVHSVFGSTRDGLNLLPGASHREPLKGGLRIGKPLESGPDGDGQYFHYLTLWMFALNRFTFVTGDEWVNEQAISLAKSILPKFMTDHDSERPRIHWKMSVDLSHPLVAEEGNLDPIDGHVTYRLLQSSQSKDSNVLEEEIMYLKKTVDAKIAEYDSSDPLDLGMMLWKVHWFFPEEKWARKLMTRVIFWVKRLVADKYFELPLDKRVAYRDFGLVLGLRSIFQHEKYHEMMALN